MVNIFAGVLTTIDLFIILILSFVTFQFIIIAPLLAIFHLIILILFFIFIYQDFNSIFSDKPMGLLQFVRGIGMVYVLGPLLLIGILAATIMAFGSP